MDKTIYAICYIVSCNKDVGRSRLISVHSNVKDAWDRIKQVTKLTDTQLVKNLRYNDFEDLGTVSEYNEDTNEFTNGYDRLPIDKEHAVVNYSHQPPLLPYLCCGSYIVIVECEIGDDLNDLINQLEPQW